MRTPRTMHALPDMYPDKETETWSVAVWIEGSEPEICGGFATREAMTEFIGNEARKLIREGGLVIHQFSPAILNGGSK